MGKEERGEEGKEGERERENVEGGEPGLLLSLDANNVR